MSAGSGLASCPFDKLDVHHGLKSCVLTGEETGQDSVVVPGVPTGRQGSHDYLEEIQKKDAVRLLGRSARGIPGWRVAAALPGKNIYARILLETDESVQRGRWDMYRERARQARERRIEMLETVNVAVYRVWRNAQ